jgi:hypothetical protein
MGVSVRPSTTNFKKSTFGIIVRIQGVGAVPLLITVKCLPPSSNTIG